MNTLNTARDLAFRVILRIAVRTVRQLVRQWMRRRGTSFTGPAMTPGPSRVMSDLP